MDYFMVYSHIFIDIQYIYYNIMLFCELIHQILRYWPFKFVLF
jgi:hypothetical protein